MSEPAPLFAACSSPRRRNPGQHLQRSSGEAITKAPIRRPLRLPATQQRQIPSIQRYCGEHSFSHRRRSRPWTLIRVSAKALPRGVVDQQVRHRCIPTARFMIVLLHPHPQSLPWVDASLPNNLHLFLIYPVLSCQTDAVNAAQSTPAVPLEKSNSAYDSL